MEGERERKHQGQLQGFLCKPLLYLEVLSGFFLTKTQPVFPEGAETVDRARTKNRKTGKKMQGKLIKSSCCFLPLLSCIADGQRAADVRWLPWDERGKPVSLIPRAVVSILTRCCQGRLSRTSRPLPAADVQKLWIRFILFLRHLLLLIPA